MRLSPQVKRVALASTCLVGLALIAAALLCSRAPIGYFGSYKMLPHDETDVLHFTNGVVSWETCCGDETVGTYKRLRGGSWIWVCVMGKKRPATNEIILRPGLLSLTCIEVSSSTNVFRLPRRFFAPKHI